MQFERFLFLATISLHSFLLTAAKALNQRQYTDFRSGENDLLQVDTSHQHSTPFPAPIIPEVVLHPAPQTTPLTFAQSQQILANRLFLQNGQAVQNYANDIATTISPKDPFVEEDPSSGQQLQQNRLTGNVSPMLLNERLMASQQLRQASVNELPVAMQPQFPKPIVPEVVVRGAAIQDMRLSGMRNNYRSCQPFL